MSIFSISPEDLKHLGADRAVDFFRRLLWSESSRVGIGKNLVDVPNCINEGDGGIDALIKEASPSSVELIPPGMSGYQIKSSDLQPAACKNELHQGNDLTKPLKPEIKKLLDANGTYILVLFDDITVQKKNDREAALREELTKLGYPSANFRVYSANQIAAFSGHFPALVAWFKNELRQCKPFSSWAKDREIGVPKSYVFDEIRGRLMSEIRDKIRNPGGECAIFRITGLPGIGKTRLVFEALSPEDIRQRVIYVKADLFRQTELYHLLQNDESIHAVVVIDECNLNQHDEYMRVFSSRGPRLVVVTISYELGNVPPPTLPYRLDPLQEKEVREILKTEYPQLPDNVISRISDFADGYPRIGILLGDGYLKKESSPEEFMTISHDSLINNLIGGGIDTNSDRFEKIERVLTAISLFAKVGYEDKLKKESEWLAQFCRITHQEFIDIVIKQKERGIIQGEYFIYVTPFMLRVHLIKKWWENHGLTKETFKGLIESIPQEFQRDMMERLLEHVPYISATTRGKKFVEEIMGTDGLFSDVSVLKEKLGALFFLRLSEASPQDSLHSLKRTIGKSSKEELLQFKEGRREVVWALEKIAIHREFFQDAARLLLQLAEAEVESYGNNATGIFISLFSPGIGPVAPTEASPLERFPILIEAITSDSPERRKLGFRACGTALQTQSFSRMVGAEYQGLRKLPELWRPKTWGELFDSYRRVWEYLISNIDNFSVEDRSPTARILLEHTRGLIQMTNLSDMVLETLNALCHKPYVAKKEILGTVIEILHYEKKDLPKEALTKLMQLRDELTGTTFASLLNRYVGMDLLADKFDDAGKHVDQTEQKIADLANEAVKQPRVLIPELKWLVTEEAQNGYQFGYQLGCRDTTHELLPDLINNQKSGGKTANLYFLGGYFKAIFNKDPDRWEQELDNLAQNDDTISWLPELTWRSGMTDRAAERLLKLAQIGKIKVEQFSFYRLGGVLKILSEDTLLLWLRFLMESNHPTAADIALDFLQSFYLHHKKREALPKDVTLKILVHPSFFEEAGKSVKHQMRDYSWKEVAKVFIKQYPEESLPLVDKILEHFGNEASVVGKFHEESHEVLGEIASQQGYEVWRKIIKYLGPPIDERAFWLNSWLREGGLNAFPPEAIWSWVDEDVENRAWYLATFVPKALFQDPTRQCLARELLVRYGHREDVRNTFSSNYYSGSWSGPETLHLQEKKKALLEFRNTEENENVRKWIDEYIKGLEKDFEHARIVEERRGF